ncbi:MULTISPECIES: DUF4097 family beta strand repeat-containing protein [unclassified Mycobacterium]|uniref:DUF4097 family beta strand repeat-containing protein n=1 Tax=unclassified Mycobacterium TaxID=2642494 RepID=UPI0029C7B49F|nr:MULTISPECIES: DUF4097 family beta strand repeat-containing protein [unclassified Mycobacterium]
MTTFAPPPPAPPAEPTPPPLTPGGRTALRAIIVVVAAVLVAGTVVSLGITAWGLSGVRVVADEKGLPKDMRALIIDTGDIPAAVRLTTDRDATEPRASMRIVNSPRGGDQTLVVTADSDGTRLTITGDGSHFMDWGRAGELTVTLPAELARRLSVTVQQDDGVLLAQADVDELVARNTDGAVILSGAARRIDIRSQDGDIIAREPISVVESFNANVVDGNVSVEFKDAAPRKIEVVSVDGDIELALPDQGPYLVHASADSTQIRVPETNDPARAVAEVTARSDDGNVTVSTRGRGPLSHR